MPAVVVRVAQRHMQGSKRGSACNCPFAHAVNEVIPYGIRVAVGRNKLTVLGIKIPGRPPSVEIPLPEGVVAILDHYDRGGPMMLCSLTLEFPDL